MGDKVVLRVSTKDRAAVLAAARRFSGKPTPSTRDELIAAVGSIVNALEVDSSADRFEDDPKKTEKIHRAKSEKK